VPVFRQPIFYQGNVASLLTGDKTFLFSTSSRMAVRLTQPAVLWVHGASFLSVEQLGCEAGHTHAFSTEVKNELSTNFAIHVCLLGMHKDRTTYNLCKQ
jgi:hypothetical protein